MVLHLRQYNLVPAFLKKGGKRIGNEIKRLCRIPCEDYFVLFCPYKGANFTMRLFEKLSRFFTERIHSPMDIRILSFVISFESADNGDWLLCCGGIVQIDQSLSRHLYLEDGKIFFQLLCC